MNMTRIFAATAAAGLLSAAAAFAGDIMVKDPYARSSTPSSVTGAAFFTLMNHGSEDDRLIAASSDVASRVEIHTHKEDEQGVMRMMELDGGIPLAAGAMHQLKRGGDHLMFMGLSEPLTQGQEIAVTLRFENAGEVEVMIPVDLERKPQHGGMDHSHMDHSNDS
ncbi:MAG: copper chaperone PCu(A)C [Pseudomonadota bacterium]